ncbi:hypothetical protein ACTHAM_001258 [Cellulomonas soli]|uniref:hypothetical protein n=1 Tax=Cellulomonas soli TaxID=931535 RepID=UPI003F842824
MSTQRLSAGILNGHLLSDQALHRLAPLVGEITHFHTAIDDRGFAARWARTAPDAPLRDGGRAYDVRHAVIECARRQILVLATPQPDQPARFLAGAAQGAAMATDLGVPGIAIQVMRDRDVPGDVAWMTQSGRMSGYGVLFAVGFAQAHRSSATLVEPTTGISELKTPEALERAFDLAASAGVELGVRSEVDPLEHVLQGSYSIAITPVLDVPGGRALLRPGELPLSSVASGNPGAVVRLLEEFPGDVVAVLDGVELLDGRAEAARIASAVMLAVVAAGGLGLAAAPRASAAPFASAGAASSVSATVTAPDGLLAHDGANLEVVSPTDTARLASTGSETGVLVALSAAMIAAGGALAATGHPRRENGGD